ncbi:hypothetical protein BXZ70DRAFT_514674 [Cristinia sonorae]|uniref:S-adenosyl-L-methionine-dependent methyltransferase n=1 Tax=Cristinia sonorae TaxID=1940300 RepID=A0A8K0XTH9_9AGAR|nr:hypothetical protein BXZ70DRAFT_514674 [Cristinia sonorae]
MKLINALSILPEMRGAVAIAFMPTLRDIFNNPTLLLHPVQIQQVFMKHLWALYGDGMDEGNKVTKQRLISINAKGVVLDIGAGYGHTASYLDPTLVTKYIALEPNTFMHPEIRTRAASAGFTESDGTLQILSFGAQETDLICAALRNEGCTSAGVDTIISIHSLCSIPSPQKSLYGLLEHVLKNGGKFLYFEHVRNTREDAAWWQGFWSPCWSLLFGGCRLDRATDVWVDEWDGWGSEEGMKVAWRTDEEDESTNFFCHRVGQYVKTQK